MSFAGILNGEYVVWHNRIAQIDVKLFPSFHSLNKIEMVIAVNNDNLESCVGVFYKTNDASPMHLLMQMTPPVGIVCPDDGSFIDVVYSCAFAPIAASDLRFIITRDGTIQKELTPVKKYRLYENNALIVGGSTYEINDLGWQTGEVFKTIFKYLPVPPSLNGNTTLLVGGIVAIAAQKFIAIDSSGQFVLANQTDVSQMNKIIGITKAIANPGESVSFIGYGEAVNPLWNFVAGEPVFLGVNGNVTQTPPVTGFIMIVGFATATTKLFVNMQTPIDLAV